MRHKDYKTINLWLRDLRQKQYVGWIYATSFSEKTKPAVYYLGLNGIRFLKTFTAVDDDGEEYYDYPVEALRKRYREATRSQSYIDRCLLLADCCIEFKKPQPDGTHRRYATEAEYLVEDNDYHFLVDSDWIHPHLCYRKYDAKNKLIASVLLEVFDTNLPRYRIKKRLSNYSQFLDSGDWETETEEKRLPVIMFVCPRTTDLIYAKRRMRGLLAHTWERDDTARPDVRFATIEKLKERGITEKIWEKA